MKKIIGALLALCTSVAFAATTVPIQLLNPTGSSSGQAIVSTGASSAPAWGGPFAALTGATFTGATAVSYSSPIFSINDTSSANTALLALKNNGTTEWGVYNNSASSNAFAVGRYNGGAFVDNPLSISNSTGLVTLGDGVSATTILASSTITPSQTAGIVGTTTNNNANAGSVGEYVTASANAVALTNATAVNITSISLTAGDWDVWGEVNFVPAGTTVETVRQAGITTTSATMPAANGASTLLSYSVTGLTNSVTVVPQRISLSATTTVYLVATANFTTSTDAGYGFIGARRRR